jgi:hypothetical protein
MMDIDSAWLDQSKIVERIQAAKSGTTMPNCTGTCCSKTLINRKLSKEEYLPQFYFPAVSPSKDCRFLGLGGRKRWLKKKKKKPLRNIKRECSCRAL